MVSKASNGANRKKLTEAVLVYIRDGGKPPSPLKLAFDCHGWNTLPKEGGYLSQEYRMMRNMNAAYNIYHAVNKVKSAQGSQIHNLSFQERRILKPLYEQGML